MMTSGHVPSLSYSHATGRISFSAKSWAISRMFSCSSVRVKSTIVVPRFIGGLGGLCLITLLAPPSPPGLTSESPRDKGGGKTRRILGAKVGRSPNAYLRRKPWSIHSGMSSGKKPDDAVTPWPHSRQEAEVEAVVSALRGYGVLTRARLAEVSGAVHWSDSGFRRALDQAVSSGMIRRLGDDLYEIGEPESRRRCPALEDQRSRTSSTSTTALLCSWSRAA